MKDEYDFSGAERGKFYEADAQFYFPVYLRPDIAQFIDKVAGKKGIESEALVNDWLERDIRIVEAAG